MVKVRVKRKHSIIQDIQIKGHAGYAKSGEDLVCAGVSSIAIGMMNALDKLVKDSCFLEMDTAYIHISVIKQEVKEVQLLLEALLIQLDTLQKSYQKYIKIYNEEV